MSYYANTVSIRQKAQKKASGASSSDGVKHGQEGLCESMVLRFALCSFYQQEIQSKRKLHGAGDTWSPQGHWGDAQHIIPWPQNHQGHRRAELPQANPMFSLQSAASSPSA